MSDNKNELKAMSLLKGRIENLDEHPDEISNYIDVLSCIKECRFSVPYIANEPFDLGNIENLKAGDVISVDHSVTGSPAFIGTNRDEKLLPMFTDEELQGAHQSGLFPSNILMSFHFSDILERAMHYNADGIILNTMPDTF